ncbi:hypothetical protein B0H17DRAFT_1121371 [Mycena rosella]|uniref:Uncharacterized protein n=1 Tax=Mycena rosella TaxID=1033263 RepID=A0AAD7AY35_MYCRO|nr:hypothetical protein B0H17DRAFT_1121371 [Mycena rosella]
MPSCFRNFRSASCTMRIVGDIAAPLAGGGLFSRPSFFLNFLSSLRIDSAARSIAGDMRARPTLPWLGARCCCCCCCGPA